MAKNTVVEDAPKISEDDLRSKLQSFQGEVQGRVDDKKSTIVTIAGIAGLTLLVVFFLLGKRSGKKKSAIVEIRRV